MRCGWSSTRRRSSWSRLRSRWCPHPTSSGGQVGIRLVDLLEALGRLVHIVAISVGVVEECQLLEGFFYGCLVRFLVESQHFEVLRAGGGRHRSLSASGQPRAAQVPTCPRRAHGSEAWIGGLAERSSQQAKDEGLVIPAETTQRTCQEQLDRRAYGVLLSFRNYDCKRRAPWNSLEPSGGSGAMALLRVAALLSRRRVAECVAACREVRIRS